MTSFARELEQFRKTEYKRGIDKDTMRRKREEYQFSIRKKKRDEKLSKKRKIPICYGNNIQENNIQIDKTVMNKIYSNDPTVVLSSLKYIRKISCITKIDLIIKTDIVPKLIEFLSYVKYQEHQYETGWILTNLTSGTTKQTDAVIRKGPIVSYLIDALRCTNSSSLQLQFIWCIANIAGNGQKKVKEILSLGGLNVLSNIVKTNLCGSKRNLELIENSMWVILNILVARPPLQIIKQCLVIITKVLSTCSDSAVLVEVSSCVNVISRLFSDEECKLLFESGIINPKFIKMLDMKDKIAINVLRTIGNIISGPDFLAEEILNMGFLRYVPKFMMHKNTKIQKEICWILSNIAAGTKSQMKCLIESNLVSGVIKLFKNGTFSVKKECLYVMSNLSDTPVFIDYIVSCGYIKSLGFDLSLWAEDPDFAILILQTLDKIICGAESRDKYHHYLNLMKDEGIIDRIDNMALCVNNRKILKLCEKILGKIYIYR